MSRRKRRRAAVDLENREHAVAKQITTGDLDEGGKAPPAKLKPEELEPPVKLPPIRDFSGTEALRVPAEKADVKPGMDPEAQTTADLKQAHWRLHVLFGKKAASQETVAGMSVEDIVNLHAMVVDELFGRGIEHPPPPDNGLDATSEDFERNAEKQPKWHSPPESNVKKGRYAAVNRSGDEDGPEITLESVLPHFKGFMMRKPYISLVGGLANHGSTKGDIDVLVSDMDDAPGWMKEVIEFRIGRAMPPELSKRLHVHFDRIRGPFTNHVDLYDLKLERRDDDVVVEMAEDEVPGNVCTDLDQLRSWLSREKSAEQVD